MGIKKFRPYTPSRRQMAVLTNEELTKNAQATKSLLAPLNGKKGGRNNNGRITAFHRGGGQKRRYRVIDFKRNKDGIPAKVTSIEYDPNRSSHIALITYKDGVKSYIVAPKDLKVGDFVESGEQADIKTGNCKKMKDIPLGTYIHNIELRPKGGAKLVRSAGGQAKLMAKIDNYVLLKMPSGEQRKIHEECRATIGQVGNQDNEKVNLGKAGKKRWLGRRPIVRGVAMNPVDHPLGGGEGRSSGGRHPTTPWGRPTKGYKTRKNKRTSKFIVKRRNAKKGSS